MGRRLQTCVCSATGCKSSTARAAQHFASRRKVFGGAAVFAATAVAAPPLTLADETQVKESALPTPNDGQADWLFQDGYIYTVNASQPTVEAVAVRGKRDRLRRRQGRRRSMEGSEYQGRRTRRRMLMPGFIDSHDHLATLGVTKARGQPQRASGKTPFSTPSASGLRGSHRKQFCAASAGCCTPFGEELPRREWLDEVTGDRPMYLISADIHETWFNTAAMKAAGLDGAPPIRTRASSTTCATPAAPSGSL